MRFIRRDGSEGNFEPTQYSRYATVADGVLLNVSYTPDGAHGESVHFETHVIQQLEDSAFSGDAGKMLAGVALEWAEKLPHTIDYPKERP